MNHLQKYYIVEAELAGARGNAPLAMANYEKAIDFAAKTGYLSELALAWELAGKFYYKQGNNNLASIYLSNAHYHYSIWGAKNKTEQLENEFSQFSLYNYENIQKETRETTISNTFTSDSNSSVLDVSSILKASRAISREIILKDLLSKMLDVVIENAGADKGIFLLKRGQNYFIEAESDLKESNKKVKTPRLFIKDDSRLPVTLINYIIRTGKTIVLSDAVNSEQFGKDKYIRENKCRSIFSFSLVSQGKRNGIVYLENRLLDKVFTSERVEVLTMLSSQMSISIENAVLYENLQNSLEQQQELTNSFARFVPREFLSFLGKKSITDIELGDQIEKEMTVLFSDIRDFTKLSEAMSPRENFLFINSYLSQMEPVIAKFNGFIDKYIGDSIMALFPTGADDALKACILMREKLKSYNLGRNKAGYAPVKIGIGLNTGKLMLGTVGGKNRMDSTVISDAVNLASRVEGLCKIYKAPLLITENTLNSLEEQKKHQIRFIDRVKVKGKEEPVSIFEVMDGEEKDH
jgi:class 3 adenylate cyclase